MNEFVDGIKIQRKVSLQNLELVRILVALMLTFLLLQILDKDGSNDVLKLYRKLATENVVRFRGAGQNSNGALRVSVGTAEENLILVEEFEKGLEEFSQIAEES